MADTTVHSHGRARATHTSSGHSRSDLLRILLGALLIVAGVLALTMSVAATMSMVLLSGAVLIGAGLVVLIEAIAHRKTRSLWRGVIVGGLYLLLGAMMWMQPLFGASLLTAMLIGGLLVLGVSRIIGGLAMRERGRGWEILAGVVSVCLAVYLLTQWPLTALWLLGTIVGVELTMTGIVMIAHGLRGRRGQWGTSSSSSSSRRVQPAH